jgi:hypothetical protein
MKSKDEGEGMKSKDEGGRMKDELYLSVCLAS